MALKLYGGLGLRAKLQTQGINIEMIKQIAYPHEVVFKTNLHILVLNITINKLQLTECGKAECLVPSSVFL